MKYAKFLVSAGFAGLTALAAAISDDKITKAEWVAIGLAVVGAIGVWAVPNKPTAPEAVQTLRDSRANVTGPL